MEQYTKLINSAKQVGEGLKKVLPYGDDFIVVNITERKMSVLDTIVNFDSLLDFTISADTKTDPRVELVNAFAASKSGAKTKTNTGSMIGRSVVGGIVAGVPGAIIGGLTADKETEEFHRLDSSYQDFTITLSTKDLFNPTYTIHVGASKEKTEELANTFRAIIASNDSNSLSEPEINQKQYLEQLYQRGRDYKAELNLTCDGFVLHYENEEKACEIYMQILVNDVSSEEAKFYYFFFESILYRSSKYSYKYHQLYSEYTSLLKNYLLELKHTNSFENELDAICNETEIYAHYLGGGYINERKYEYMLLLTVGDIIYTTFGNEASSVSMRLWAAGISKHHADNSTPGKKMDVSDYVEKVKKNNPNYVEPKVSKDLFAGWDSDMILGCIAILLIIGAIIYFLV